MREIILESARLRVVVDAETGAVREVGRPDAGLTLIAQPDLAARQAFMVVFEDGSTLRGGRECIVEETASKHTVDLRWALDDGLEVRVSLRLDPVAGVLHCRSSLRNPRRLPVAALAYPYIGGIGRLGDDPAQDELVHPYATGFLVRNPLDRLPPAPSEVSGQEPLVLGLYPEGFSGATMQFMAYSAVGRGGFYVGAEDAEGAEKWLNFYRRQEDGDLCLAVWHGPRDYAGEREVAPAYEVVLAALDGGTWYDAADRYKEWALTQSWMSRGPLWARADRPRRLLEEVGLCTFGVNARHDRSAWLSAIDDLAGTPVLHVLGPNWPRVGADYQGILPGGLADWFPAQFDPRNLEVMRAHGDLVVPFEFDLLFGRDEGRAEVEEGVEALQVIPARTLSRDAYAFPFLCPVSPFTRALHVARDQTLVAETGVDGVYYDISVNNVRHICVAPHHGHAVGDSRALTRAYRALLQDTAEAMREAAGGVSLPQGTEMINEQMLPAVDFYQARAEASPASTFEASPFRALIKEGSAEKIPLFAYVYHEYGPLRLDGWAKLSKVQGDYVYFVLGRVFLQGGLIELNYEFSSLEDLDEQQDMVHEHYYSFDERRERIDPDLALFVGSLARARVGPANRYLAYGAMRRPAPLRIEGADMLTLDYHLYNCDKSFADFGDRGALSVPAVLQVAWRYRDQSAAWLLLNVDVTPRTVHVAIDVRVERGLVPGPWTLTLHQNGEGAVDLGTVATATTLTLTLAPRVPVMIEALPLAPRQGVEERREREDPSWPV